jgi:isoleucyl-tRNA synthetase
MAPFTPFMADEVYQNLVHSVFPEAPDSVHLADFPVADQSTIDKQLGDDNRLAMKVCSMGRAARTRAKIKIRQPLEHCYVGVSSDRESRAVERMSPLILDELNIKELRAEKLEIVSGLESGSYAVITEGGISIAVYMPITMELEAEGMAREIVHRIQTMRRTAGYEIADHIIMYYDGPANFVQSISAFADYIRQEVLADDIDDIIPDGVDLKEEHKVNGYSLTIAIKKAA